MADQRNNHPISNFSMAPGSAWDIQNSVFLSDRQGGQTVLQTCVAFGNQTRPSSLLYVLEIATINIQVNYSIFVQAKP